jgi:hypothetical protein
LDAAGRLDDAKRVEAKGRADAAFGGRRSEEWMTYTELVQAIAEGQRKSESTAKKWVKEWLRLGVLEKSRTLYRRAS